MIAHTDKPSNAQMAQALEWFRNAMNYLRTQTYVHIPKAYCASIEEALINCQAPSVRTVSRDAGAGTSEPVAWLGRDPKGGAAIAHVGKTMPKREDYLRPIVWQPLYAHPATPPSPELEQARVALVEMVRLFQYCLDEDIETFCRKHGPTVLAALERAK